MVTLIILAFVVSLLLCLAVCRYGTAHARRYADATPQRFHVGAVPRLGGLAIFGGFVAALALVLASDSVRAQIRVHLTYPLALQSLAIILPAFLGGLYEDATQRLAVRWRMLLTLASGLIAAWLMGAAVPRLGIGWLDSLWHTSAWLGVALAVFAIAGLPHAFNIIDGYNGLAGTVAMLVCVALGHVALQLGDRQLAAVVLSLAGATAGFLVLNFPRGLIFAGDGGAYLWGLVIALCSIVLVQRHPVVSPWFPMLLLIYPVWETMFSIYRKFTRGQSPGVADALHFHQLIYRRIVRGVFHDDEARRMLMRNNRTSPYLWGFTMLTVAPAVIFWQDTYILMALCLLFITTYVAAYLMIVRFKVPRFLRK
jgi:UDP-GlcNAc:undecaprenyl-phosphate GlcNAc-1-phosphate transferase